MGETKAVQEPRDIGRAEAEVTAARLREMLPAELSPLIDFSFVRSHLLYEEFVCRLILRVLQEVGLEEKLRTGGSVQEIARREGLDVERALVPLEWMLRHLTARTVLDEAPGEDPPRFCARGPLPVEDPAPVREEQSRHDASWMPSYVLAETVAEASPASLRGELPGDAGVLLELRGGLGSGALAVHGRFETPRRLDAIRDYRLTGLVPAFLRR